MAMAAKSLPVDNPAAFFKRTSRRSSSGWMRPLTCEVADRAFRSGLYTDGGKQTLPVSPSFVESENKTGLVLLTPSHWAEKSTAEKVCVSVHLLYFLSRSLVSPSCMKMLCLYTV